MFKKLSKALADDYRKPLRHFIHDDEGHEVTAEIFMLFTLVMLPYVLIAQGRLPNSSILDLTIILLTPYLVGRVVFFTIMGALQYFVQPPNEDSTRDEDGGRNDDEAQVTGVAEPSIGNSPNNQ